jgi:hypothetical protein
VVNKHGLYSLNLSVTSLFSHLWNILSRFLSPKSSAWFWEGVYNLERQGEIVSNTYPLSTLGEGWPREADECSFLSHGRNFFLRGCGRFLMVIQGIAGRLIPDLIFLGKCGIIKDR